MVMTQRTVCRLLQLFTFEEFDAPHTCGRTQVIHDRVGFVESFSCDDMLVSDAFVLVGRRRAVAMKPDVMLPRNLAQSLIKWHLKPPLLVTTKAELLTLPSPLGKRRGECDSVKRNTRHARHRPLFASPLRGERIKVRGGAISFP